MIDTDRVALTLALYELADRFVLEAKFIEQTKPSETQLCLDIAGRLSDHARSVLSNGSVMHAEAYLWAGDKLLNEMQDERRKR